MEAKENFKHEDSDPLQEIPGTDPDTLKAVLAIKEAAEKHFLEKYSWTGVNHLPYREEDVRLMKEDFIAGAKYQAKRMYSEQEVRKIVWESRKFFHGYDNTPFSQIRNGFNNWFEKFKKK